jgi:hypothetical protein
MSPRAVRRSALTAALAGLLVAALVAAFVPRQQSSQAASPGRADPLVPVPAPAGDPARPRVAPARREPSGASFVRLRAIGRVSVEARMPDPRGGPEWAIRTFRVERYVRERGHDHAISTGACAQLGRLLRGRFGWVDAANTFRPVRISLRGAPWWCGSRTPDLRGEPELQVMTRITDPRVGAARATQTIVWGIVGSAGTPAVAVDGTPARAVTGPHGTFLLAAPSAHAADVELTASYPGRPPVHRAISFRAGAERFAKRLAPQPLPSGRRLPAPALPVRGARPTVELRLPDPNGGLPWGISAAPADGGGWCTSGLARIVGDRVGAVDYELGTFTDAPPSPNGGCPTPGQGPSRARPLAFGYSGGGGLAGELGQDPLAGRTARRTQRGATTYWDLERLGGRVYALATIPMRKLRRNELRAFVLDDERARSS